MAVLWSNALILVFAHFVVSQTLNRCGEPPRYPDKQLAVKYLDRFMFNDQEYVHYRCPRGYMPSKGSGLSFCKKGRWTYVNLKCQPAYCNGPADIENGQYRRQGHSFGDKAIAFCNQGYVLSGDRVRMCMEHGWSGTDPICVESNVTCSPPDVTNRLLKCEVKSKYKPQETVKFTCSEGFDLIGSSEVACGLDGQWGELPECRLKVPKIVCLAPAVENRLIKPGEKSQYTPQETVRITCSEGFDLIGSSDVTCGPDSQWRDLPECRRKGKCGPPPSHPNAFLRDKPSLLMDYPPGVRIRYKCDVGYSRASGSDAIRCLDGQWTKLRLQCQRKRCGSAGEISFGRFQYSGVSFGDSATAICQEGYELIGPTVRVCRDGGWDARNPVCEPVHCPPPPEVKDAEVSGFMNEHVPLAHMVSYRCLTGALIGTKDLYCTPSGTWSGPPPQCKDITCPRPYVPRGSRMRGFRSVYKYGNTVTITCNPGLRLIGEGFVTCGADGKWTPKLPECRR